MPKKRNVPRFARRPSMTRCGREQWASPRRFRSKPDRPALSEKQEKDGEHCGDQDNGKPDARPTSELSLLSVVLAGLAIDSVGHGLSSLKKRKQRTSGADRSGRRSTKQYTTRLARSRCGCLDSSCGGTLPRGVRPFRSPAVPRPLPVRHWLGSRDRPGASDVPTAHCALISPVSPLVHSS